MTDDTYPADDDLQARYDLLFELERMVADIELDDLTREDLIELIAVFDRIGPDTDNRDWTNVAAFPAQSRRSTSPSVSWALFKDKIRRERQRIGRLIGAETAQPLPPGVASLEGRSNSPTTPR